MATIKAGTYRFNDTLVNTQEMLDMEIWELFIDMEFDDLHGNSYQQLYYMTPSYIGMAKSKDHEEFVKLPIDRTIIIKNDVNKGSLVCDWFTTNTTEVKTAETIKTGTYRFNDVLSNTPPQEGLEFTCDAVSYLGFSSRGDVEGTFYEVMFGTTDDYMDGMYVYHSSAGWYAHKYQTITISTDQEVSTEFAEWFKDNTECLLGGTWRLNDVIIPPAMDLGVSAPFIANGVTYHKGAVLTTIDSSGTVLVYGTEDHLDIGEPHTVIVYADGEAKATLEENYDITLPNGWLDDAYKTVTFARDGFSGEWYNWFTANATPVTLAATVSHNGEVIAALNGGQTATLKCTGMKVVGDVVVAVADRNDLVMQTKEVTVTENGTIQITPDSGYIGLSKVTVAVEGTGESDPNSLDAKVADFWVKAFPSDTWVDGEYTGYIQGLPVTMRYKYRAGKTDPKNIPFVGTLHDWNEENQYQIENLADFYLVASVLPEIGRMKVDTENGLSSVYFDNTIIPTFFDLSAMYIAMAGVECNCTLTAIQAGAKNYDGQSNSNCHTRVTFYLECDLFEMMGNIGGMIYNTPISLEWYHESYYAYCGMSARYGQMMSWVFTFTVGGIDYEAEEGMTWGEWVSSSYNTGGFVLRTWGETKGVANPSDTPVAHTNSVKVRESEAIIADGHYLITDD